MTAQTQAISTVTEFVWETKSRMLNATSSATSTYEAVRDIIVPFSSQTLSPLVTQRCNRGDYTSGCCCSARDRRAGADSNGLADTSCRRDSPPCA
jgi:hypothetical protein